MPVKRFKQLVRKLSQGEELTHSKTDLKNLEIIYKNSSCKCVDSSNYENCDSLQKKIHYLLKTMDNFSRGQFNF